MVPLAVNARLFASGAAGGRKGACDMAVYGRASLMPWLNSTLFGRVDIECWGAGVDGYSHDRAGVVMTSRSGVEAG